MIRFKLSFLDLGWIWVGGLVGWFAFGVGLPLGLGLIFDQAAGEAPLVGRL